MTSITADETDQILPNLDSIPKIREVLERVYGGWEHVRPPANLIAGGVVLQGCLPLLMEEISTEDLIHLIGQKKYKQLRFLYRQSSFLNMWYGLELKRVLESLTAAQIQVMVLKGADLASSLYPRPELRHFNDVDLLVRPEDLTITIAILEGLGYSYHQEYRFEANSKQRAAFVYVKKGPNGYTVFEIHTRLHSNEMGVSFAPLQIWERARLITVAGVSVFGMGLEDLLVYLCWHYRSHVFDRLIWLYDIAIILRRYADRLDWTLAHRIAYESGLAATLYFSVLWCKLVFNIAIPAKARIERFMPPNIILRLIACLVGDDLTFVLQRIALRERKILQRLMVDNVRMLCLVAVRTIVPSPTHLGRLHMEHSRLPLSFFWLYYPLHFLTVLKAVVRYRQRS